MVIRVSYGRGLPLFLGVTEPEDYLARVVRSFGAHEATTAPPVLPTGLSLPEALGYLDAVWQAQARTRLLGISRPAAAAKMAAACASADEFDARLSAVADILGSLTVQLSAVQQQEADEAKEGSLVRLRRSLKAKLGPEAFERASAAVGDLQDAVRIRAGGQHSDATSEIPARFARLGVKYPPPDWGGAWEQVRVRCTTAVNAIREELEAANPA